MNKSLKPTPKPPKPSIFKIGKGKVGEAEIGKAAKAIWKDITTPEKLDRMEP